MESEPTYKSHAMQYWLSQLRSGDLMDQIGALDAIVHMGVAAKAAVRDIIAVLQNETLPPAVRALAAEGLGRIGTQAGTAVAELVNGLEDSDALVRISSMTALEAIGKEDERATAALLKFAGSADKSPSERAAALRAVAAMVRPYVIRKDDKVVDRLQAILVAKETPIWVRRGIVQTLGRLRAGRDDVIKGLRSRITDPNLQCDVAIAIICITRTADLNVERSIITGLKDRVGAIDAIAALYRLNADEYMALYQLVSAEGMVVIVRALEEVLDESKYDLVSRQMGAVVLGRIGAAGERAVPLLIRALHSEGLDSRKEAVIALGRVGIKARAAEEPLRTILNDEEQAVWLRKLAHEALRNVLGS